MNLPELLRWQWDGYPRYHRSRSNLLLHIVVVPLFVLGDVAIGVAMWPRPGRSRPRRRRDGRLAGRSRAADTAASPSPPEPFTGPLNAIARLLCEQWITFPRFVLSGGWRDALRRADR